MRADANPGDSPTTVDNKRRTPCEVDGVDPYRLVHTVRPRHLSVLIEKNRKGVGVFFDVLFSAKEAVDFLRRNKCNSGVAFFEFIVSRLELSQLVRAVRSPGAANEYQYQRSPAIVGKANGFSIGRGNGEIWGRIAGSKRF